MVVKRRSKVFRLWYKDELQTLPPSFISDNRAVEGTFGEGNDSSFIFTASYDSFRPKSENTINKTLRNMGYDTKQDICGHGFRALACNALIKSGLWLEEQYSFK